MAKPRSYDTEEAREDYVQRLTARVEKIVTEEAPPGIGSLPTTWERIAPASDKVMIATTRFIRGEGTKEEADEACLALIEEWRRSFREGRSPHHPSLGTQTRS